MNTRRNPKKQIPRTSKLQFYIVSLQNFQLQWIKFTWSKIHMQELEEEEAPACAVVPHNFAKQKLQSWHEESAADMITSLQQSSCPGGGKSTQRIFNATKAAQFSCNLVWSDVNFIYLEQVLVVSSNRTLWSSEALFVSCSSSSTGNY
jgi:hypothetical protein